MGHRRLCGHEWERRAVGTNGMRLWAWMGSLRLVPHEGKKASTNVCTLRSRQAGRRIIQNYERRGAGSFSESTLESGNYVGTLSVPTLGPAEIPDFWVLHLLAAVKAAPENNDLFHGAS